MRALGFDPGTATTGYGAVEGRDNRLRHIAHGVIATPAGMPPAQRLLMLHREAARLLEAYRPDAVCIERLYFGRNITTGIAVAQARGVILLAAAQAGVPIGEFGPAQIKTAITGYGKADKRQVQEMVRILLNLDAPPRPDDAADALGLAVAQVHAGIPAGA